MVLLNKRVENIDKDPSIYDLYDSLAKDSKFEKGTFEYDDIYDKLLNISGFRKSKTRKHRKKVKKHTRKKI